MDTATKQALARIDYKLERLIDLLEKILENQEKK